MDLSRRAFLKGSVAILAAPAIVRAESLMRVSSSGIMIPDDEIVIAERAKPIIAPEWAMDGVMSAPSYADIKDGNCKEIVVGGVRYHVFKRDSRAHG